MQKSSLMVTIGFLILLLSLSYIVVTTVFYQRQNQTIPSFASLSPLTRQIMVVDINRTDIFSTTAVTDGRLPILVIHTSTNFAIHRQDEFDFLDHIGRLLVFDENYNNRIDSMDPIYPFLELVYVHQKQIMSTVPIGAAGIRAIFLDQEHLTQTELFPGGPTGYWNVTNIALMADGTTRLIKVIPIDANDLPTYTLFSPIG